MNEFEMIGRQTVQIENLKRNYAELLGLVGRIKRGEVDPALVLTDEAAQTWVIVPGVKVETPPPTPSPTSDVPNIVTLGPGAKFEHDGITCIGEEPK